MQRSYYYFITLLSLWLLSYNIWLFPFGMAYTLSLMYSWFSFVSAFFKFQFIIGSGENMSDFTYSENVSHAHICAAEALDSQMEFVAGKVTLMHVYLPKDPWKRMTFIFYEFFLCWLYVGIFYHKPQASQILGLCKPHCWRSGIPKVNEHTNSFWYSETCCELLYLAVSLFSGVCCSMARRSLRISEPTLNVPFLNHLHS